MARYSVLERQSLPPKPDKDLEKDLRIFRKVLLFLLLASALATLGNALVYAGLRFGLESLFVFSDPESSGKTASFVINGAWGLFAFWLIWRLHRPLDAGAGMDNLPFMLPNFIGALFTMMVIYLFGTKGVLLALNWFAANELFTQNDVSNASRGATIFLVLWFITLTPLFERLKTKASPPTPE